MATSLRLSIGRHDDGVTVLTAVGELDLSNVAEFSAALGAAVNVGRDGTPLRVDLSGVDYLDSGAINVLFDHAQSIDVVANPILLPVLNLSGLADVTTVTPAPPG